MRVISGNLATLPSGLYTKIARYRYEVFVERLGWDLKTFGGLEYDQFDRRDTIHIVAENDDGRIVGCARLLPTVRPYLLGEVFPYLLDDEVPPCSDAIWELSRFAAFDHLSETVGQVKQCSSPVAVDILRESIMSAANQGAKRLITVSPVGVERLLRLAGFKARRAGRAMIINGHAIVACWIDVVDEKPRHQSADLMRAHEVGKISHCQ